MGKEKGEVEETKVVFSLENAIKFGFGFGIGMFVWGLVLGVILTLMMIGITGTLSMAR